MKKRHFIAVLLPSVVACGHPQKTQNPPEYPPPSYSERQVNGDGTCAVTMTANPPMQIPVSCEAEIVYNGETGGCMVESAADPAQMVSVACPAGYGNTVNPPEPPER